MREYGFEKDSVFVRWLSFGDAASLQRKMCSVVPDKINVGPMRSVEPALHKKVRTPNVVTCREIIFDIDLDDYGNVDKDDLDACDRAFPIVVIGLMVLESILRVHFGFRHILFVASGRRGAHVWVCDERACALNDEARAAVVTYMQPCSAEGKRFWRSFVEHPGFAELTTKVLLPRFTDLACKPLSEGGMGLLDTLYQRRAFCNAVHESVARDVLSSITDCDRVSGVKAFKKIVSYAKRSHLKWLTSKVQQEVWELVGPRLDINVTKQSGHMLKPPFSPHPKTGRISLPLGTTMDNPLPFPVHETPNVAGLANGDDEEQAARFNAAVQTLQDFVESMEQARKVAHVASTASSSISSTTDVLEKTPKRARDETAVFDLTDAQSAIGAHPSVYSGIPRLGLLVERSFYAVHDGGNSTTCSVYTTLEEPRARFSSVWLTRYNIASGQVAPVPVVDGGKVPLNPEASVRRALRTAREEHAPQGNRPAKVWHACSRRSLVVVTSPHLKQWTPAMHATIDALMAATKERELVCTVNMAWDDAAIDSFLRMRIGDRLAAQLDDESALSWPQAPADKPAA